MVEDVNVPSGMTRIRISQMSPSPVAFNGAAIGLSWPLRSHRFSDAQMTDIQPGRSWGHDGSPSGSGGCHSLSN